LWTAAVGLAVLATSGGNVNAILIGSSEGVSANAAAAQRSSSKLTIIKP
jgi:hypothetical protein